MLLTVPASREDICEALLKHVRTEWDIPPGSAVCVCAKGMDYLIKVETPDEKLSPSES